MDTKDYIAQKIQEFREARHWKQSELGAMLNPPKGGGTISSWETGRTTPDADTLINLCQIFQVDISAFYPGHAKQQSVDLADDEQKLIDLYRKLPRFGKRVTMKNITALVEEYDDENYDEGRSLMLSSDMTDSEVKEAVLRYEKEVGFNS